MERGEEGPARISRGCSGEGMGGKWNRALSGEGEEDVEACGDEVGMTSFLLEGRRAAGLSEERPSAGATSESKVLEGGGDLGRAPNPKIL